MNLPIMLREGEHLMPRHLHGTRLMNVDMSGVGCQDPFIELQHRVDDHHIGLSTANQEEHFSIRTLTSLDDLFAGSLTKLVKTVTGSEFLIRIYQVLQHLGMHTVVIVALERNHFSSSLKL